MRDYTFHTVLQNLKEHLFEFLISEDFSKFKDLPEPERTQKANLYIKEHVQSIFEIWQAKVFDDQSKDPLALLFNEVISNEFYYPFDMSEMLKKVDSPL